jgi:hypothetical protein
MGDDLTMLKTSDDKAYCTKQVNKMCYYIKKIHNIEILKIKAEFSKDDNGSIWFVEAS